MFDDDEIKEIDDTLSAKEAEAFAKQIAAEAKKKKRRKSSKKRSYRQCTAGCLLYTSPSPRDATLSRMPSSA